MTKKRATKMVAVVASAGALADFTVGGNLDISDVLSVVTSRAEERYSNEIVRCRNEAAATKEEMDALQVSVDKLAGREAVAAHREVAQNARDGLKPLGYAVTLIARRYQILSEGKLFSVLRISQKNHSTTETQLTAEPSEKLLVKYEELAEMKTAIAVFKEDALNWKRKLNNVPMLERKYRAKIATTKLASDAKGQELLALMEDGLDDEIDALTSV